MIPSQTSQVLYGVGIALLYACAVMAIGVLLLKVCIGRQASAAVRARVGLFCYVWLGFVTGQGILGVLWLVLSLAGIFYSWFIWIACVTGWISVCVLVFTQRQQAGQVVRLIWTGFWSFLNSRTWYFWLGMGVVIVILFQGLSAFLPPTANDSLRMYLLMPKTIAATHKIELWPFVAPFYSLQPLQVEMHSAALYAISNETAVTVWDYLCALSFLSGIGSLAWSLTSSLRVSLLAILIMLSTPGFFLLMGGGRPDIAAAQYGIAAFLWLLLWPALGLRAIVLVGLCAGWAVASRYVNVVFFPALIVFAAVVAHRTWGVFSVDTAVKRSKSSWMAYVLVGGIAAGVAVAPMFIKNWLLLGCPLVPYLGCQDTIQVAVYKVSSSQLPNISVVDLLFYPFVWTFAERRDMLGNISPFFIGSFPFLLICRRFPLVRLGLLAGIAGLVSLATWLLIEPLALHSRWFLVPLGLLAVSLSASVVAAERDGLTVRWLVRGAAFVILFFMLIESRDVVYAVRYLTSRDNRAALYESAPEFGYDAAIWLNVNMRPEERVALGDPRVFRYFLSPDVLLRSESFDELKWLWEHGRLTYHLHTISHSPWSSDAWHFYAKQGFTYVIADKDSVNDAASAWPDDIAGTKLQVAFVGKTNTVLKIQRGGL